MIFLGDRCVNKCNVEYADCSFPSAANIVDYISCVVVFDKVNELVEGLNAFTRMVDNNDCGAVRLIIKCRNSFANLRKSANRKVEYKYYDVKFNVIIVDPKTRRSIIGEVQFMLNWMYQAKVVEFCLGLFFVILTINFMNKAAVFCGFREVTCICHFEARKDL